MTLLEMAWVHCVQVTLLAAVVALVGLALRYRMPRLMYGLWLLVLIKCLVPPVIVHPLFDFGVIKSRHWTAKSTQGFQRTVDFGDTLVAAGRMDSRQSDGNDPKSTIKIQWSTGPAGNVSESEWKSTGQVLASQPKEPSWTSDKERSRPMSAANSVQQNPLVSADRTAVRWRRDGGNADENGRLSASLSRFWAGLQGNVLFTWVILGVWASGLIIVMLIRLARYVRFLNRVVNTRRGCPDNIKEQLERLKCQLGIQRQVDIAMSSQITSPCVAGLFCPVILFPERMVRDGSPDALQGEAMNMVLAHELSHVRRGDLLLGIFQNIVTGIWWFHPLVRFGSRQLSLQTELLCDEAVVADLKCERASYARQLIGVIEFAAKHSGDRGPAVSGVLQMSALGRTRNRLERVMRVKPRKGPWVNGFVILFVSATAIFVIPGARPSVVAQDGNGVSPAPLGTQDAGINLPSDRNTASGGRKDVRSSEQDLNERESGVQKEAVVEGVLGTVPETEMEPVTGSVRGKTSSVVTVLRTYDFSQQIDEHRRMGRRTDEQCKQSIETALQFQLQSWDDLEATEPAVKMAWIGNQLHVFGTARQQGIVAEQRQQTDLSKRPQMMISTRFFEADHEAIKQATWSLGLNWFALPNGEGQSRLKDGETRVIEPPAAMDYQRWKASSWQSSTNAVPLLLAFLDDLETRAFVQTIQERSDAKLMQAPKMAVFDSQPATLESAALRPFATSVMWEEKQGAREEIEVVRHGTLLHVIPHLLDKDIIGLRFACEQSDIPSVASYELPTKSRNAHLEAPRVLRKRLASDLTMRSGETLLFCWLDFSGDQRGKIRLLALTTDVIEDAGKFPEQEKQWTLPSDSEQAAMQRGLVPLTHFPDRQSFAKKSEHPEAPEEDVVPLPSRVAQELSKWGMAIQVKDLAKFEVLSETEVAINAERIGVSIPNAAIPMLDVETVDIAAKTLIVSVADDRLTMNFDSPLQMESDDLRLAAAKSGEITLIREGEGEDAAKKLRMNLQGDVRCAFDEDFQMSGESLELSEEGWLLEGNARIRASLDGKSAKEVQGERIELNVNFPAFIVQQREMEEPADETEGSGIRR